MFALRGLGPKARMMANVPRQAAVLQQKRGMAGGDDEPDSNFVNWWDNPKNPDIWHKHQLAWWGVAFWGVVFYGLFGRKGSKTEEPAPAQS